MGLFAKNNEFKPVLEEGVMMVLIAVENNVAQHLHANTRLADEQRLMRTDAWSIRVTGDFMIVMNNLLSLPVIVRHPQRFSDPRAFTATFKRELIRLLEVLPVPRVKVRMIRDAQLKQVEFVRPVVPALQQRLQIFQNLLTRPDIVQWDDDPSNPAISLALMKNLKLQDVKTNEVQTATELFENYVINNFAIPAHPKLNEHNRRYLYHSESLNDVMNESEVSEEIIQDYRSSLEQLGKSDQIIDRDTDYATDYLSYLAEDGKTILDDISTIYYYAYDYGKRNSERLTTSKYRGMGAAFREFGRFLKRQALFADADFDQFSQALNQAIDNATPAKEGYRLERMLHSAESELARRRSSLKHAHHYRKIEYQIKVELADYQPSMWRRLQFSGETRLDELCYFIMASFGATGSHLYNLQLNKKNYQLPYLDGGENITLHWLGEAQQGDRLTLEYDFGDSWQFNILIEKTTPIRRYRLSPTEPKVLDGNGKGIVDDIGGTAGLELAAQDDQTINSGFNANQLQKQWFALTAEIAKQYQ